MVFLKITQDYYLVQEKKFLITLKADYFKKQQQQQKLDKIPTCEPTLEPTPELATGPTKQKKSKLKLRQEFINEIISDEKEINGEIFCNYFKCQNPSFLAKDLIRAQLSTNELLVDNINDGLTDLRKAIIKKEIPEN